MRPQVRVRVEANESGEMLRSFVIALLKPLVKTCDVHIEVLFATGPDQAEPTGVIARLLALCDEWDALSKGESPTTARIRAALRTET